MLGTKPLLWFDAQAGAAAQCCPSVLPHTRTTRTTRTARSASAPDAGPQRTVDEAVSFVVRCEDQAEVDHYWAALTEGGSESECGWCKDRFGLSWQVVPVELFDLLADPDPARAARATQAMLHMVKLDLAALRAAADAG